VDDHGHVESGFFALGMMLENFVYGLASGVATVALIVLFIARNRTPESSRWLQHKDQSADAEREAA
jgi:hypothetical protein